MSAGPGAASQPASGEGVASRWGAFGYATYRRFWMASLVRIVGMQFHIFAIGWLVVDTLDRSAIWLGAAGLAQAAPNILLSFVGGWLADRMEHKRLLVISQTLMALNYLLLAVLITSGIINIWIVLAWGAVTGSLSAVGNPAQQAILPRLIDMRAIASAVAAMNAIWNMSRVIAPGSAGVLIAAMGVGQAFFVAAGAFAISIVMLLMIRLAPIANDQQADRSFLGGLRYVASSRVFIAVIGLSFFSSMFGMSYQYLLPIFARNVLDAGSTGFGMMGAAAGIGALLGTISSVRLARTAHRGPLMVGSAAIFGILVAGFAQSPSLELSIVLLFGAGFMSQIYLNIGMTTLQVLVPNHLRGRVMAVWSITWFLTPVGAFVVGAGAEVIGAQSMVMVGGLSVTVFALLLYAISPDLRAIPARDEAREPARAT